jgi:5-methyltetrahydrofolate--homocysteine methyltransferase
MELLENIAIKVEEGDSNTLKKLTEEALESHISAEEILSHGLLKGMNSIGVKFKNNDVFIPEVLIAAKAMKSAMEILKPHLIEANVEFKGKIMLGTVQGDLHDIGKNIVGMMLEGAGYEVIDLGSDISNEQFIQQVKKEQPHILGMSALLTTTMTRMGEVVKDLEKENLKERVKVIIGGAPVTQSFSDQIKADGYAPDAASAVDIVNALVS